jgi:hypothetical protein
VLYYEIEGIEIKESEAKGVKIGIDLQSESVVEAKCKGRGERSHCWTETTARVVMMRIGLLMGSGFCNLYVGPSKCYKKIGGGGGGKVSYNLEFFVFKLNI